MIGTGGYVLAAFALVIGFAVGTVAGVVNDWVRDVVDRLRVWAVYGLAFCGIAGLLYAAARGYYASR